VEKLSSFISLGAGIGGGLLSLFGNLDAQSKANDAAKLVARQFRTTYAQIKSSQATQKESLGYRTRQVLGEIAVLSSESGTGSNSGTAHDLETSVLAKGFIDSNTIDQNAKSQISQAYTGALSQVQEIQNNTPGLLSLDVLNSGLGLFNSFENLRTSEWDFTLGKKSTT